MATIAEQCDSCRAVAKVFYYAASRRALCLPCIAEGVDRAEPAHLEHRISHRARVLYPSCVWCSVGPSMASAA